VIALARPIESPKIALFVGFNPIVTGQLQGRYVLHHVPNGNILEINGPATDDIAVKQNQGFASHRYDSPLAMAVISGRFHIALPWWSASWSRNQASIGTTHGVFDSGKNISAVVTQNDVLAAGSIRVLSRTRPKPLTPVVTGAGGSLLGLRALLSGTQSMTAFEPAVTEAPVVATAVSDLLSNTPVKDNFPHRFTLKVGRVPAVLLDPTVVTAATIEQRVIHNRYLGTSAAVDGEMTVKTLCSGLSSACKARHIHPVS
jgi:ABC-type xylose transport system substrate-binding protein